MGKGVEKLVGEQLFSIVKSIPSYNQDKWAVEKKDQLLMQLLHLSILYKKDERKKT